MNNYVTANTIKTLREKKGLTQLKLAEMLSVSDKTVSKWETGKGLCPIYRCRSRSQRRWEYPSRSFSRERSSQTKMFRQISDE